jgi:MATE family multidrug resistance protein
MQINDLISELKPLFGLTVLIATLEVVEHIMVICDLFVVGKLGELQFASVGLAGVYFWVLIVVAMSPLSVIGVIVAEAQFKHLGKDAINLRCAHGFWVVVAMMAIPFGFMTWFMANLLAMTGIDPTLLPIIAEYTQVLIYVLHFAMLFVWLRNYFSGLEISKPITLIALAAAPANLGLNFLLVFGIGDWPGMRVKGAGYGTSIINSLMLVALIAVLYQRDRESFLSILKHIRKINFPIIGQILRTGSGPSAIALLAATMSVTALAAHNLVFAVLELGMLISVGIGETAMVRVAFHLGRKDATGIRHTLWIGLVLGTVSMCLCAAILALFPEFFLTILLENATEDSAAILLVMQSFILAAALRLSGDLQYRAKEHSKK